MPPAVEREGARYAARADRGVDIFVERIADSVASTDAAALWANGPRDEGLGHLLLEIGCA